MATMQKTAVELFEEYRLDYEAALEPCIACLLLYCPEQESEQLHELLDDYHSSMTTPPYSPVQMRRLHDKVQPIFDRVMRDPATIAQNDQLEARWRDTPWLVKRWRRLRFMWLVVRLRCSSATRAKPWE